MGGRTPGWIGLCAWRQLPHDFPPWETVFWYHKRWREDGVVDRLHDALRAVCGMRRSRPDGLRRLRGRPVGQGRRHRRGGRRGFDAGKKVNGRKRHVVVDTLGLLLLVVVTAASVQDRDGARTLLDRLKMAMPSLSLLWADGGYAGKLVDWADRSPTSPSRSCVNPWE